MNANASLRAQKDPTAPGKRLGRFFQRVMSSWTQASESAGDATECFLEVGGHTLRLCFAGPALVPLITPAIQHLAVGSTATPALTVCLWDSSSTGVAMPPPAWSWDAHIVRGELNGVADPRFAAAFDLGPGALSMLDRTENLGLYWVRDARQIPYFESAAPLRTILHWFMNDHGRQFTHAAAVGTAAGAVLLAGKGGSGKSTAALTCIEAGLRYLGDDYVLLRNEPSPRVYSLYCTGKLEATQARRLPGLFHAVRNPDRLAMEKAVYSFHNHFRGESTDTLPLRAILLPQVSGSRETTLRKTSPAAALRALAPSTIFQLPGAGHHDFHALSAIVRQVPLYILDVGTHLLGIPPVIRQLLEES